MRAVLWLASFAATVPTLDPLAQIAPVVYRQPPYFQYELQRDVLIDGEPIEHRVFTVYGRGGTAWHVLDQKTGRVTYDAPDGGNIFAPPNCADTLHSAPACITPAEYSILSVTPAERGPQGAVDVALAPKAAVNPLTDAILDSRTWRVVEIDSQTSIQLTLDKTDVNVPARLTLLYDAVSGYYALRQMDMLGHSDGHEILMEFRYTNVTTPDRLDDALFTPPSR